MSEQLDGIEGFRQSLHTFADALAGAIRQAVEAALPVLNSIREALWEAYRQAEMPYGNSQEGLMHWMEDMGKIKHHEAEIERILQHHDNLITGRKIGEEIRARRAAEEEQGEC